MPNTIQFDVSFKKPGQSGQSRIPRRYKLLVMGDFSGRKSTFSTPLEHPAHQVDCDNLEQRMRQLGPSLDLSLGDNSARRLHIEFSELEGFHPDRLYDRLELFDELRSLRKSLLNPQTFAETARSIRGEEVQILSAAERPPVTGGDSFADLLGKPVIQDRTAAQPHPAVAGLIRKFVSPHIVGEPGPEQDRLVDSVDAAVSVQMREILHHEDFQALESTWRGLDFLIRELELDNGLSVHIVDLAKSQLALELPGSGLPEDSGLYKTLVTDAGGTAGTDAWNLIVGLYDFAMSDKGLLHSIANLARNAGTTFMSGISYRSLPAEPDPEWESLQQSQMAAHLCLVTPGLLLRLPYGANTDEIDRFEFEEMPEAPVHEHYLWGNAALVCAALIAKSLGRDDVRPGGVTRLDGLPVHSYRVQGETRMTPCGGAWLSDRDADRLSRRGVIPVLSVKNSDAVRVTGFQSLAGGPVLV
ncbi:MAG: type VI secretion system contractile sheath large subunit [Methylococcaceae bacterium]|nr:type VI secretion system contractile sheath large subunit [Methylococcaceae bacterium]MCI0734139.1 type VI secretion system contractile sheath large subunit [Methylococcaceae bacterium]